jgi:hypothetical protein
MFKPSRTFALTRVMLRFPPAVLCGLVATLVGLSSLFAPVLTVLALAGLATLAAVADGFRLPGRLTLLCLLGIALVWVFAGTGLALVVLLGWLLTTTAGESLSQLRRIQAIDGQVDPAPVRAWLMGAPVVAAAIVVAGNLDLGLGGLALADFTLPIEAKFGVWCLMGAALLDWLTRRGASWRLDALHLPSFGHEAAHWLVFAGIGVLVGDPTALAVTLLAWRLASLQPLALMVLLPTAPAWIAAGRGGVGLPRARVMPVDLFR